MDAYFDSIDLDILLSKGLFKFESCLMYISVTFNVKTWSIYYNCGVKITFIVLFFNKVSLKTKSHFRYLNVHLVFIICANEDLPQYMNYLIACCDQICHVLVILIM